MWSARPFFPRKFPEAHAWLYRAKSSVNTIATMMCYQLFRVLLTFVYFILCANGTDLDVKQEMQAMTEQIEILKKLHLADVSRLKSEIEDIKDRTLAASTSNQAQNEQVTLAWAKSSMNELRMQMREMSDRVNSSVLLYQLHDIRNELKQALMEKTDLAQLARTQEIRIDKLDNEVHGIKHEQQQIRVMFAEIRSHVGQLAKEVKKKQMNEFADSYNSVYNSQKKGQEERNSVHVRKYRHNKMIHTQILRLARSQDQLDKYQQNLQTQVLDVQRRLDRFEESNWNLLSAKVEFLELETQVLHGELKNDTLKISDLDRVHASMLELREDLESVENKADKTIPEFRKEISKLDISYAQLNAQSSYIKENQENIRQSVKAIAVSISNAIDRAEMDRLMMKKINDSVVELQSRTKQHYYRLNDHILKSEANNNDANISEIIPLPELMGEVKELQPVQREYEDLVSQLPKDCSSVYGQAGTYLIHPGHTPIDAWCSNGSTLLQRRYNGTIEFNRKFDDYARGFGDTSGEYWLGLESMHQLTADNCSSMRIDMTDIYGGEWYAQYERFYVGSSDTGYVLEISGFKGNASDAFEYQNHMEFSAIDRDRDISNTHCAGNYEGGWWFSHCQHVNINGKYTLGLTWFDSARNEWIAVATSEMRLFRAPECS